MTRKIYYERNLPHWQPPGATFFLTYRLAGSIPQRLLDHLCAELAAQEKNLHDVESGSPLDNQIQKLQRWSFGKLESLLDGSQNGPTWLCEPEIAGLVADSLAYCAQHFVDLWAYTIMPNHVHALLRHHQDAPLLCEIMKRHKGLTARQANRLLGRHGPFWQSETFDHVVRDDDEFDRILQYILLNPVKAGLAATWKDWPWTYVHPDLLLT